LEQTYQHARQLVAVDCIIFGYEDADLKVVAFQRKLNPGRGAWSLVGGWVNHDESVEEAAQRVLHEITGLENIFLEQVEVFSKIDRDPGDRVISVAFYAFMRIGQQDKKLVEEYGAHWFSLRELPELVFDHQDMLDKALDKLRRKASYQLVGSELLPDRFTLLQLRKLYEAIYQRELDPGNFRKKVLGLGILRQLSSKDMSESKKGAYYFKFKKAGTGQNMERIIKL